MKLEQLPRNIDDREFRFTTHLDEKTGQRKRTRTDQLFSRQDIETMLGVLPDNFKLYVCLCLNCGFTQADLSALQKEELRLDQGRIVRQRTKTRRHSSPPIVNYKLWGETLDLLKQQISDDLDLVLLNSRGTPLIVSKLTIKDGNEFHTKHDTVCRQYGRLRKRFPEVNPQ